jgi:cytoskeletal protein RodZ
MSFMEPVGPLPPGVYWRRRLVVLVVAILVVAFLWWLVAGRASGGGGATPTPAPTNSATSTPSPTSTPTPAPTPSPTSTDSAPRCPDEAIKVSVLADPVSSPAGSEMKFTLVITNTYASPCKRDVGARANELQVVSAITVQWSSDDCNPSKEVNEVVLMPNENYPTDVTWDQRTSKKGCPAKTSSVDPGNLVVFGRNGEVVSEGTAFAITAS